MENSSNKMPVLRFSTAIACLIFVLLFGTGTSIVYFAAKGVQSDQNALLDDLVHSQAIAIERRLNRSLSSTYILAQEVRRSNGNFKDFDKFADEVIKSLGGISNLQLAPNGIVQRIYPLAGSEKAIGHNILKDDARTKEALLAIKTRGLTLAGPFELIQGGIALIGRNPVFLNKDGEEYFWGFVSALIYLDELLAVTGIEDLPVNEYQFAISRIHPDSGVEEVFSRSKADLLEDAIIKSITVPNSSWAIGVSRESKLELIIVPGIIISFIVASILTFFLYRMLLEPERLRRKVTQQTEDLERLAFHDELTGLANRRFLAEKLEQELLNLKRHGRHLALLYIDLDDFKRINDTLGHNVGDVLLKVAADRICDTVRESDIVARMGGDEFTVVLLDVAGVDQARSVAEKIIEAISSPMTLGEHEVVIGSTIGITLAPDDSMEINQLFRYADLAMYASKKAGKNGYSFFNSEMQQIVTDHLLMEVSLRQAIVKNEFYLVYQPIIFLESQQSQKFEALIRWRHPLNGDLSPDDFIAVAEETGLIMPIGYWVLREVCELLISRQQARLEPVSITINISSAQLKDENFAHQVEKIVKSTGADPRLIEMEITESMLMEDVELALQLVNQLKELGMTISIDDFGTGYSSLAKLKKFPVDTLKIDRSFVMDLDDDINDRQIVEAITAMVHKLGISVVAEGVETESQLQFLLDIGCDSGQGYLFSKPFSSADIERFDRPESIKRANRK